MGLKLFPGNAGGDLGPGETRRDRFGAYFPRVFAYVQHNTGDEGVTRELVAEAFTRAFSMSGESKEGEYRLALFRAARELCEGARVPTPAEECLTPRERDIISLLFDAQLGRGEVASILEMEEAAVTPELVRALKKLRAGLGPSAVPSFLRLS